MASLPTPLQQRSLPQIYIQQQKDAAQQRKQAEQLRIYNQQKAVADKAYYETTVLPQLPDEIRSWAISQSQSTGNYPSIEAINSRIDAYNAKQQADYNAQISQYNAEKSAYDKAQEVISTQYNEYKQRVIDAINRGDLPQQHSFGPNDIYIKTIGDPLVDKYIEARNAGVAGVRGLQIQKDTARLEQEIASHVVSGKALELQPKQVSSLSVPNNTISTGILGGTKDYLQRADFIKPSDLGDARTQQLVSQGYSVESALNKQMTETTNKRAQEFYRNELDKALQSNIAVSSAYHHWAADTGLPQKVNPFENVGDISLAIKQPQVKDSFQGMPSALGVLGLLPSGKTVQVVGFERAVATEKKQAIPSYPSFASALGVLDTARTTGDLGVYGTLKSTSDGKTLSIEEQQKVASKAWVPTIPVGAQIYGGYETSNLKEALGYGRQYIKPSDVAIAKSSSGLADRLEEQYGVKFSDAQKRLIDKSYEVSSSAAKQFFSAQDEAEAEKKKGIFTDSNGNKWIKNKTSGTYIALSNKKVESVAPEPEQPKGFLDITTRGVAFRPQALGEATSEIESSFDQLFGYTRKGGYLSRNVDVLGAAGAFQNAVGKFTTYNLPNLEGVSTKQAGEAIKPVLTISTFGAAAPFLYGTKEGQATAEFTGEGLKTVYQEIRAKPIEDLFWYSTPKLYKGGKYVLEKGVAALALSQSPKLSTAGRLLSTPTAVDVGKAAELGIAAYLAAPAVESIITAEPTPKGKGEAVGKAAYPLILGVAGIPASRALFNKPVYNPYAGKEYFSGAEGKRPSQKLKEKIGEKFNRYTSNEGYRIPGTTRFVSKPTAKAAAIAGGLTGAAAISYLYGPQIQKIKEQSPLLPIAAGLVAGSLGTRTSSEAKTLRDLAIEKYPDQPIVKGMKLVLKETPKYEQEPSWKHELEIETEMQKAMEGVTAAPVINRQRTVNRFESIIGETYKKPSELEIIQPSRGYGLFYYNTSIKKTKQEKQPNQTTQLQPQIPTDFVFPPIQTFGKPTVQESYTIYNKPIKRPSYTAVKYEKPQRTEKSTTPTPKITYATSILYTSTKPQKPEITTPKVPKQQTRVEYFSYKQPEIIKPPPKKTPKIFITSGIVNPPSGGGGGKATSVFATIAPTQTKPVYGLLTYTQKKKRIKRKRKVEKPLHWEYGRGAEPEEAAAFGIFGRQLGTTKQTKKKKQKQLSRKRVKTGSWMDRVIT